MKKLLIVVAFIIMISFINISTVIADDVDDCIVEIKSTSLVQKFTLNIKSMQKMNYYKFIFNDGYNYY